ncbi:unnamed protein product [Urochloa humidicola]
MEDKEAPARSTASGGDRISALPDGVRELVLSVLPAHEAVRTAVLARSWRDLWMRSPALRITGWGSIEKFNQFVECLLRLHCSAPVSERHPSSDPRAAPALLDSCHFDFGILDFFDEENMIENMAIYEKRTNYWFKCALRCQVRVLQYCFSGSDKYPLELLDLNLVSGHLTKLELTGVSTGSNINLSGCPVLRDLKMEDCYLYVREIQSPYLQHLRMANCRFLLLNRTLIRLPNLISLKLTECSGRAPSLTACHPWQLPLLHWIHIIGMTVVGCLALMFVAETTVKVVRIIIIMTPKLTAQTACFSMVFLKLQTWSCQLILKRLFSDGI